MNYITIDNLSASILYTTKVKGFNLSKNKISLNYLLK
jgi:hypothetical protein